MEIHLKTMPKHETQFDLPLPPAAGLAACRAAIAALSWRVTGRQLDIQDILGLQQIAPMVSPGRYWMDAQGNFGYETRVAVRDMRVVVPPPTR